MNSFYFWKIVIFMAIGTFAIRSSVIYLSSTIKISAFAKKVFTFIPAAILPALVAPMVFYHQGSSELLLGNERLLILLVSITVMYKTKNILATIAFGLVCLYLVLLFPLTY